MAKYKRKAYGNAVKCTYRGIDFDSKLEMNEYIRLKDLEDRGVIRSLMCQPKLELVAGFYVKTNAVKAQRSKQKNIEYTPDFFYIHGMEEVLVEVKGYVTPLYRLRKRLFLSMMDKFCEVFIEVGAKYRHEYRLIK